MKKPIHKFILKLYSVIYGNLLICSFYMCHKTKALNRHLTCVPGPYAPSRVTLFRYFSHILPCNLQMVSLTSLKLYFFVSKIKALRLTFNLYMRLLNNLSRRVFFLNDQKIEQKWFDLNTHTKKIIIIVNYTKWVLQK